MRSLSRSHIGSTTSVDTARALSSGIIGGSKERRYLQFRVWGLGFSRYLQFRVQGLGFSLGLSLGFRVWGLGFSRKEGTCSLGFRVEFRVWGLGFRV
jgi:hypothetical protein